MRAILLPVLAGTALAMLAGCSKQTHASEPAKQQTASQPANPQPTYNQAPTDRPKPAPAPAPAAAKLDETKYDHFGAGIATTPKPTPIADVVKNPDQFTGKTVVIEAPIAAVCEKKGCWMDLGVPAAMHVTFKDYGFFVPLDATGRTAIVEGTMTKKNDKLAFVATGVAITKPPAK